MREITRSVPSTVLPSLLRGAFWYADAFERALQDHGLKPLTRGQHFVLANIVAGERQGSRIAKNLGVSRQAVSQTIMQLKKLGYVRTKSDPEDKRSRIVEFSPSFEDNRACMEIFAALDDELSRRIGKTNFKNLYDALEADWGPTPILESTRKRKR